jgi:predicted RNA-binding Zn ribbon-like protein
LLVTFDPVGAGPRFEDKLLTTLEKNEEFRDGMPFLGGAAWIDLLNSTLSPDGGATRLDFLAEPGAFARWLGHAGLDARGDLSREGRAAADLREAMRPEFDRLAAAKRVAPAFLERINAELARAPFVRSLVAEPDEGRYALTDRALAPRAGATTAIALDFARFITDFEPQRLKHCDNPACTMVFYDRGKNSRRRWCSSSVCGNRDKVANYRARKRAAPRT